jgi:endonuclease YncB( thermonuclease family)
LLNRGDVTLAAGSARSERKVEADGRDVAAMMVDAGVARPATGLQRGWCDATSGE